MTAVTTDLGASPPLLRWLHFVLVSIYLGGVGAFLVATRRLRLGVSPVGVALAALGRLRRLVGGGRA